MSSVSFFCIYIILNCLFFPDHNTFELGLVWIKIVSTIPIAISAKHLRENSRNACFSQIFSWDLRRMDLLTFFKIWTKLKKSIREQKFSRFILFIRGHIPRLLILFSRISWHIIGFDKIIIFRLVSIELRILNITSSLHQFLEKKTILSQNLQIIPISVNTLNLLIIKSVLAKKLVFSPVMSAPVHLWDQILWWKTR